MRYLKVENLTKIYTDTPIIDQLSFTVDQGQKVALVAKNGGGKSTLLRLIMNQLDKTDGHIEWRKWLKIWYLPQHFPGDQERTVVDYLFDAHNPRAQLLKSYQETLHQDQQSEVLQGILDQMEALQVWDYEAKVQTVIARLELWNLLEQSLRSLSWGELKRVDLARTLIEEPDFLILDEPTNHLDLGMIERLENYLKTQVSTLLMVTHDRYFLESVCNQIYELDRGKIHTYPGNYSYFLEKQAERKTNEAIATEKMRQLLKRELAWIRKAPRARATKQYYREKQFYELEASYDAQKELLHAEAQKFSISMQERRLGTKILKVKNLQKAFEKKKILTGFTHDFKHGERIGIIGKNGVGKSTFIKLLLGEMVQDAGLIERGKTVVIGHYQQEELDFSPTKRVIDVIREVGEYLILANGEKVWATQLLERFLFPPHQQYRFAAGLSGGEKRRLALLKVLMKSPNFLILDEPTNDLDLLSLSVLEDFLLNYGGCLLIISHDRSFMDRLVDHLFVFEWEGVVTDFWGTYSERNSAQSSKVEKEKNKKSDYSLDSTSNMQETLHSSVVAPTPYKFSSKEKTELEHLIRDLEHLESEKEQINRILQNKDLPYDEIALLSEHLGQLVKQIAQKEARRFELMEK